MKNKTTKNNNKEKYEKLKEDSDYIKKVNIKNENSDKKTQKSSF
jgi:hypothetical protein